MSFDPEAFDHNPYPEALVCLELTLNCLHDGVTACVRGPWLALGGNLDPIFGPYASESQIRNIPGAQSHEFNHPAFMATDVDHFIQEDVGEEMAAHVAKFIAGTPLISQAEIIGPSTPLRAANGDVASGAAAHIHAVRLHAGTAGMPIAALMVVGWIALAKYRRMTGSVLSQRESLLL